MINEIGNRKSGSQCAPTMPQGSCTVAAARAKLRGDMNQGSIDCYICVRQGYEWPFQYINQQRVQTALSGCYAAGTYSCAATDWNSFVDARSSSARGAVISAADSPSDSCAVCMAIHSGVYAMLSSGARSITNDFRPKREGERVPLPEDGWATGCGLKPPRCLAEAPGVAQFFTALDACIAVAPVEAGTDDSADTAALTACFDAIALPPWDCGTYCINGMEALLEPGSGYSRKYLELVSAWCDPTKAPADAPQKTSGTATLLVAMVAIAVALAVAVL